MYIYIYHIYIKKAPTALPPTAAGPSTTSSLLGTSAFCALAATKIENIQLQLVLCLSRNANLKRQKSKI